jgi:hypothetical protein
METLNQIMHPETDNTKSRTSAYGSPIPCFRLKARGVATPHPAELSQLDRPAKPI